MKPHKILIKRKKIHFPIVVKPVNEGSSIGVKISVNINSLYKSAKNLYAQYVNLIFEEYIGCLLYTSPSPRDDR